jgi:hypothetical protein
MKKAFLFLGLALALASCSKNDEKKSGGSIGATCRAPIADAHNRGECSIRLVTPAGSCGTVDVSGGKTTPFSWATTGGGCTLPFRAFIAGHPVSRNEDGSLNNVREFSINRGDTVGENGGMLDVGAGAFEGLESDDGTYEWLIESNGSGPASNVFRVTK